MTTLYWVLRCFHDSFSDAMLSYIIVEIPYLKIVSPIFSPFYLVHWNNHETFRNFYLGPGAV